jgi:hypothetical protein
VVGRRAWVILFFLISIIWVGVKGYLENYEGGGGETGPTPCCRLCAVPLLEKREKRGTPGVF